MDHLEELGLAALLAAAAFSASPPTVAGFAPGYTNTWSTRLGPFNPFELAFVLLLCGWLVRSLVDRPRTTAFDRPLLTLALALGGLQALALPQSGGDLAYLAPDLERVVLLVAGYLVVTRSVRDFAALRIFALLLAAVICLRAAELTVVYGIAGNTGFVTALSGTALLITEDSFLLILPVMLAWGAMVDGRQRLWEMIATVVGTAAVFLVNLLSLRRGAVIVIGGAVVVRSLAIGTRRLLLLGAAIVVVGAVLVAGPAQSVFNQAKYTVTSSLLSSNNTGSTQRRSEIQNFARNLTGPEWLTGRGVGVLWRAEVRTPVDSASYGSEETPFNRIGWHVYGLDIAYKFGLLGVALILFTAYVLGRRAVSAFRQAGPERRWMIYSLGVCSVPFAAFVFTNPRIALFAGVVIGLLSRCCDLAAADEAPAAA